MKRIVPGLVVLAIVGLALSAFPVRADPVNVSYSDPASDVAKLWTSNMTPVKDAAGVPILSPFPDSINLQRLDSTNSSANITLTVVVKGSIATLANTSYEVRLYTRADNRTHLLVRYTNGITILDSNETGFTPRNITGNSTVTSTGPNPTTQNTLVIKVAKALLGTLTYWNIDATAAQRESVYTYQDTIWELPGNPGSAPLPTPAPTGYLENWWWLLVALVVALGAIVAIVFLVRRRKESPPPRNP